MALPNLLRKLFKNDGYGPEIKDERLSTDITVKDWDASHDYPASVLAKAGGNIYRSVAASGPGTSAGVKDPSSDNGTYWVQMSSVADVDSIVSGKGYALDSNVVHKTGNESVSGLKTFTSDVITNGNLKSESGSSGKGVAVKNTTVEKKSNFSIQNFANAIFSFLDKNSKLISLIILEVDSNRNNAIWLRLYNPANANDEHCSVRFEASTDFSYFWFAPSTNGNNKVRCGDAGSRWSQVYAVSGTINTSDERVKTSISSIPDEVLDVWDSINFIQYQFKDAVADKGVAARIHSGLIAQRIDEAFKASGLDASRYALFCHDSWEARPESYDENGNVVNPAVEAGDEYSLRYEEALCMEAACQRRRAGRAEARIASLEARLAALEAKLNG